MNLKEALESCKKAISINPDDVEAYLRLGDVYCQIGFNYEAINAYKQAISLKPDFIKAYFQLSVAYRKQGRDEEAIKTYESLLNAPLNDAKIYRFLGSYFWRLKDYNSAIIAYEKSLEIEPNNEKTYFSLGLAYCITGQIKEAHETFRKILSIKPDFVIARSILGAISMILGDRKNALKEYDAVNEFNPKLADELLSFIKKRIEDPSDFKEDEFNYPYRHYKVDRLCKAIKADGFESPLKSPENTIQWLNELLQITDLYDTFFGKQGVQKSSKVIKELIKETETCRNRDFSQLDDEKQNNIKRLNRLLLEKYYSHEIPYSGTKSSDDILKSELLKFINRNVREKNEESDISISSTNGNDSYIPSFHQIFFAHELTLRRASNDMRKLEAPLSSAMVDLNPHQIDAALFAFKGPLSKGAILCDEVGLGKTIEAGLIICQLWAEGKRKIIVVVPASIRKQWQNELLEKFSVLCLIVDGVEYKAAKKQGMINPFDRGEVVIVSIPGSVKSFL